MKASLNNFELAANDPYWKEWHPASGHRAGWRVVRGYSPVEELCGKSGKRIIFKTYVTAEKRAEELNTKFTKK